MLQLICVLFRYQSVAFVYSGADRKNPTSGHASLSG